MKNKSECYEDYNLNAFTEEIANHFIIKDSMTLKNGKRKLFYISPKA